MTAHFTTLNAVLGVIGSVGLLATLVVSLYAFNRNKTGDGKYQ